MTKTLKPAETYTHTHTHTHTCSPLLSLKQIGTICFLSIISISPTFADNETPAYITNASDCNQGVLQTDTGPAALEANYSANTINTKWYSDGTRLTGAGIPGTCTYDNALSLPAAQTKPGYAFGGWTLRVAAPAPVVPTLATVDSSIDATSTTYEENSWSATFSYGTVTGYAQVEGDPTNVFSTSFEADLQCTGGMMTVGCCVCYINTFTPTNGVVQNIESSRGATDGMSRDQSWVFSQGCGSICASMIGYSSDVRTDLYFAAGEQ